MFKTLHDAVRMTPSSRNLKQENVCGLVLYWYYPRSVTEQILCVQPSQHL